ncbi:MAG: hypothetical protein V3V10_03625 [Planctomycetota bacterium]
MDNRTKSVRMEAELHKALKTLCSYMDATMEDVITAGIQGLWKDTFGDTPMPGQKKAKGRKKK